MMLPAASAAPSGASLATTPASAAGLTSPLGVASANAPTAAPPAKGSAKATNKTDFATALAQAVLAAPPPQVNAAAAGAATNAAAATQDSAPAIPPSSGPPTLAIAQGNSLSKQDALAQAAPSSLPALVPSKANSDSEDPSEPDPTVAPLEPTGSSQASAKVALPNSANKTMPAEAAWAAGFSKDASGAPASSVEASNPTPPALPHGVVSSDIPIATKQAGPDQHSQGTGSAQVERGSSESLLAAAAPASAAALDARAAARTDSSAAEQISRAVLAQADELKSQGHALVHLQLDPPGLGQVRLQLTAAGQSVQARVVVQVQSTQQMLEGQAHVLRERLQDAGMTLERFDVQYQTGDSPHNQQHAQAEQQPADESPGTVSLSSPKQASTRASTLSLIDLVA
jgi:flagellar hook-length control protein FliK